MTKEASPDLTVFVQQCLHNQTVNGQISFQNGEAFANVVLKFTEVRHIWQKKYLFSVSSFASADCSTTENLGLDKRKSAAIFG